MSNESAPECIHHKDNRNVQVRLDYILLYRSEIKAKIIRILETWTNTKYAEWHKGIADSREQESEPPLEDLWITMSYGQFSMFAFGTVQHDAIKQYVDELVALKHIARRPHPLYPYGSPQYLLDRELLQKDLDELDIPTNLFDLGGLFLSPRKKPTPLDRNPQGRGIDTPSLGVSIPPGTGENTPPSKNTPKNPSKNLAKNTGRSASAIASCAPPNSSSSVVLVSPEKRTESSKHTAVRGRPATETSSHYPIAEVDIVDVAIGEGNRFGLSALESHAGLTDEDSEAETEKVVTPRGHKAVKQTTSTALLGAAPVPSGKQALDAAASVTPPRDMPPASGFEARVWALIEARTGMQFSATVRASPRNKAGMRNLKADTVSDAQLDRALSAMTHKKYDPFLRDNFTLTLFHERLPALARWTPPHETSGPDTQELSVDDTINFWRELVDRYDAEERGGEPHSDFERKNIAWVRAELRAVLSEAV